MGPGVQGRTTEVSATSGSDPVEQVLAELRRGLRGPGGRRRDLLAEIEDGLHDAVESGCARGLSVDRARRHAVREFGDVGAVRRDVQVELLAALSRRTALLLAASPPVLDTAWSALTRSLTTGHPVVGWDPVASMASGQSRASALVAACALVCFAILSRRSAPRWGAGAVAALAVTQVLLVSGSVAFMLASHDAAALEMLTHSAWSAPLGVVSVAALGVLFGNGAQTFALVRTTAPRPA